MKSLFTLTPPDAITPLFDFPNDFPSSLSFRFRTSRPAAGISFGSLKGIPNPSEVRFTGDSS
jgi:hypothetical protein